MSIKKLFSLRTSASKPFGFLLYFIMQPIGIFSAVVYYSGGERASIGLLVLCSALAWLVCTALFFPLRWVFRKVGWEKRAKYWQIAIFGIVISLLRRISEEVFVTALATDHPFTVGMDQVITSILVGATVSVAIAAFLGARERYEELRLAIIGERVRQLGTSIGDPIPELKNFVSQTKDMIAVRFATDDSKDLADLIKQIVDERIRPASRTLWDSESKRVRQFSLRQVMLQAITKLSSSPIIMATIFTIMLSGLTYRYAPPQEAALRLLLIFAVIFATYAIAAVVHRFIKGNPAAGAFLFFISAITALLLVTFVPELLVGPNNSVTRPIALSVGIVLMLFVSLVVNVISATRMALVDQNRVLETTIASRNLSAQEAVVMATSQARAAANYLHGTTQNKLMAAALRIETSGKKLDVNTELQTVMDILDEALSPEITELGLQGQLELIARNWEGMIDVQLDLSTVELAQGEVEYLVLCAREAISNAYRHGSADTIRLMLLHDKTAVFQDNGIGVRKGAAGLGTELYALAKKWSLETSPAGGATLRLSL